MDSFGNMVESLHDDTSATFVGGWLGSPCGYVVLSDESAEGRRGLRRILSVVELDGLQGRFRDTDPDFNICTSSELIAGFWESTARARRFCEPGAYFRCSALRALSGVRPAASHVHIFRDTFAAGCAESPRERCGGANGLWNACAVSGDLLLESDLV